MLRLTAADLSRPYKLFAQSGRTIRCHGTEQVTRTVLLRVLHSTSHEPAPRVRTEVAVVAYGIQEPVRQYDHADAE